MKADGISPNRVSFICGLKACTIAGLPEKGEEMHSELRKQGLLDNDVMLHNALIDMYMKCGRLANAQRVFDECRERNVVSWNALISGYVHHGLVDEALNSFRWMGEQSILPDAVTFVGILKGCGSIESSRMGEEIHSKVCHEGFLQTNIVFATALVDMYAKCMMLKRAQEVFDHLPERNAISWNALISGYTQSGHCDEALECFKRMQEEGFGPDAIAFSCILKACGSMGLVEKGKEIHAEVEVQHSMENNLMLGTAIVDMYAKLGLVDQAQEAFDALPVRDVIAWTSLITGYAQHGFGHKALRCFKQMRVDGFTADAFTFSCLLKACGNIGSVEEGERIHDEVRKSSLLKKSVVLGSALMDMYIKCGALAKAHEVFDELSVQNVVTWNTLIAGYAQLGHVKMTFELFNRMLLSCIVPNDVTFLILLNTCTHGGLVEEGRLYFNLMNSIYCIRPTPEHYTCMVDLYSRAGHYDEAMLFIEEAPPTNRLHMLRTFLSACQKSLNVELGRWAFKCSLQLDAKSASTYVCMSNMYAAAGMQFETDRFEALRMQNGAW
jgi:pentatricopeptide repeat protein